MPWYGTMAAGMPPGALPLASVGGLRWPARRPRILGGAVSSLLREQTKPAEMTMALGGGRWRCGCGRESTSITQGHGWRGLEDGWRGRAWIGQQATRPGWAEALLDAAAVQPRDGKSNRQGRSTSPTVWRGGTGPQVPWVSPFVRFLPCRAPGTEYLALHRRSAGMRAPPGARSGRVAVPQHACRLAASKRGRIFGPQAPTARPTFRPPCGIEGSVLGIPPLARPPKAAQGIYSVCPSRPPPPTPPHSGKANASTTTTPASRARPTP